MMISLIWGSTWLAIRIGLETLTPFISAGIRFFVGALFIYIFMKWKRISIQTDLHSLKLYIVLGLFSYVIPFGLVYWAEQFIASGLTSILIASYPIFVIIFSRLLLPNQRIGPYQLVGVVLAFIGIIVIFSENISIDLTNDFWGMIAVFTSALLQAAILIIIKKHGQHLHPLSMNFVPVLMGGVVMVVMGFLFEDSSGWQFTTGAMLSISYLALFGTAFSFTIYYWLLKRINAVILSLSSFITPIIALFLGWLILDENLSILVLIGSSLVLMGILFANFKGLRNYLREKERKIA